MSNNSSFGFKQPEDSPGFLLWQTTIVWQRMIKAALKPHGISHAQFVILAVTLWFDEQSIAPTQKRIVDKTLLDKMTVSAAIKQLGTKKLIAQKEHGEDARAKSITLTTQGRALTKKLIKAVESVDKTFFSDTGHSQTIKNLSAKVRA